MPEQLVQLSIAVTADQKTWLETRAIEQERTLSWTVRQLVELARAGEALAVQMVDGVHPAEILPQIDAAIRSSQAQPDDHEHAKARRNGAHLDVCDCGAVKGTDGTWRT